MLGKLLKYNRMKQRKKQEDVCRGICSVSYYSKIENNKIEPADDVIDQLLERLNLSRQEMLEIDPAEVKTKLLNWHKAVIQEDDKTAEREKQSAAEQVEFTEEKELKQLFQYFQFREAAWKEEETRFHDLKKRLQQPLYDGESEEVQFYAAKSRAVGAMYEEKYEEAREHLLHAFCCKEELIIPRVELTDLYMLSGACGLETGYYSASLDYLQRAVKAFDQQYDLRQSGRGRVLLARAYRLVGKHSLTEDELNKAESVSSQTRNVRLQADVLQERGLMHAEQGRSMDAVHCFQQSYRLRSGRERLVTIHAILQEFEAISSTQDILSWVAHGFETIGKLRAVRPLSPFETKYERRFHYYLLMYDEQSHGRFLQEMESVVLPFFKERKDWVSQAFYLGKMGDYCLEEKADKDLAVRYYREAADCLWKRVR
ncbi:helix-turn-helix domain-containing protein [Alkalicoccus urumqiensis]|uniref:HTH cro/C1-type domain-containing protein n=1 Tax=Alkalicoccus urumqiensis TaxID=1548213 RepID=A0A2P6MIK1_ALKUR|nr:helix-turn-helix transcriptional regulator [Alkalicoccus urumqiensis]PRO66122.1 hypothetical protein C6I21_04790 [Alkalicoccus urumqiensis]